MSISGASKPYTTYSLPTQLPTTNAMVFHDPATGTNMSPSNNPCYLVIPCLHYAHALPGLPFSPAQPQTEIKCLLLFPTPTPLCSDLDFANYYVYFFSRHVLLFC